ncbi:MAG: universal stress protein [Candidatus Eremiobacteraeota bacterium]|nr:universal stress protein [Candidatus Eremiobacteraeota bacterium]MCW5872951.1 universal stress protein [Candidatus Eremiobacteraeota bacterium]
MKILVPLNGTLQSETILPYVRGLSSSLNASILLLRVIDPLALAGDPLTATLVGKQPETRLAAEAYLRTVAEGFAETSIETNCRLGSASATICEEAKRTGCDLVVFAPHGHSGLERWLFGSVAEEVARHAPCPVLLMRGQTDPVFQHILVPSDGSETSNLVCRRLSRYAPPQVRVTLLHCTTDPPVDKPVRSRLLACLEDRTDWQLQIVEARPKTGIVDHAVDSGCDLIAMATHGRGGLLHLWRGSVTEHVARQAPCPVLVFPPAFLEH